MTDLDLLAPNIREGLSSVQEIKGTYPRVRLEGTWVEVLVDCPGTQGIYVYAVPATMVVHPGDVLSVPFGGQQVGAIALRLTTQLPADLAPDTVRLVEEVVCQNFFPPTYWTLLYRVAEYYCTPLIQVVKTALPPGLLGRSQRRIRLLRDRLPASPICTLPAAQKLLQRLQAQPAGDYTWQYLQRQVPGARGGLRELLQRGWVESYLEAPTPVRPKRQQAVTLIQEASSSTLSTRQREVLEVLKRRGGDLWLQELLQICRVSSSVIKQLEQKGCVVVQSREVLRTDGGVAQVADTPKPLTPDQRAALAKILAVLGADSAGTGTMSSQFQPFLLHGVTGSGKTEVYLQAIAPLLNQGRSALVLVPEIGLTPQLTDRFRARFGDSVKVYHSGLSEGERYDTWRQMLSGGPQVVIGTRSAVFAPLPHLGLIILDEEHDSSFKQDQPAPCYHARTIAFWRAELCQCPLILGSATPSLETWAHFHPLHPTPLPTPTYLSLPHRIHSRPHPPIEVVDMRQELLQGNRSIFSRPLQDALREMKEKDQQGILFIHRRGHSTFVSCRSCGYVLNCPHCDISLTYHQVQEGGFESLRCHYCGYGQLHPETCPSCGSPYLKHFGSGTQRVVQELNRLFPEIRCIRYDSDTTRNKGAHRALISQFVAREADLLVGTQMLTKGLDLPQVTLVGVVSADGLLHLADFRASERGFQILTQVAGRAGRGEEAGRVIFQTYVTEHPVIQAVQQQNYEAFVAAELQHRTALGYPPVGRLILLRMSGLEERQVQETAEQIAAALRPYLSQGELLGPTPALVTRVAKRFRWQILLKLPAEAGLPGCDWARLRSHCPPSVSLTIDVDPLTLL